ncbi:MAG TPA: IS66 family insertion sequence element accessory protein TnpB, partial [Roseiarcus sp.]|nr:IS66 family insertion sequence element accessory protein TnpB [Roseiarcus sp.]
MPRSANVAIQIAAFDKTAQGGRQTALTVMVQEVLAQNPHSGALFAFRGKRGDLIKLLWWDGQGL